jgi:DNA polymerase
MNGFAEREAIFLAEMGIAPLWHLRNAPPVPEAASEHMPEHVLENAPEEALSAAPAPAATPLTAAPPAAEPPTPVPPPPPGPRPLQPVAQSVSALAPVPPSDLAWDDAALPAEATPEEIAQMDWDQLALAIASCRRCSACRDGRAPVPGTGARNARWLVAAGASTAADEKARIPLSGDAGKLLDNMLAAVDLSRERDVYITNLIKCRPTTAGGGERAPTQEEATACRPFLERERVLTGAGTVLTLGQIAANTLLGRPLAEPLAGVRGKPYPLAGGAATLVATLHPGELLRRGADKAVAWADLCRARAAGGGGGTHGARGG